MFGVAGNYGNQPNQITGYNGGNEPFPILQNNPIIRPWDFGGLSFSDRVYQPNHTAVAPLPPQSNHQQLPNAPILLDLRYTVIRPADGQDIWQEASDLFVKVQEGYNIQKSSSDGPADGLEALAQGLTASFKEPGQRPLTSQEIQRLVSRGGTSDPKTSRGQIVERLTAEQLQIALNRYGVPRNVSFKLGIVRYVQQARHFEVSMPPNPPPQLGQTVIWVYEEPIGHDTITGQHKYSRWSPIAPSNITDIMAMNYAQALTSPLPKPAEPEIPVDNNFLHPGRRSTGSSQTDAHTTSTASSSNSRCCGKFWPFKTAFSQANPIASSIDFANNQLQDPRKESWAL